MDSKVVLKLGIIGLAMLVYPFSGIRIMYPKSTGLVYCGLDISQ
nr:MAG TPA: hypothetical protein [Caudoviricetes sp.]